MDAVDNVNRAQDQHHNVQYAYPALKRWAEAGEQVLQGPGDALGLGR